jgi:hypothetical protein
MYCQTIWFGQSVTEVPLFAKVKSRSAKFSKIMENLPQKAYPTGEQRY